MPINSSHLRHGKRHSHGKRRLGLGRGPPDGLEPGPGVTGRGGETSGGRHFLHWEQNGEEKGFPKKSKKTSASKPHFGRQLCLL